MEQTRIKKRSRSKWGTTPWLKTEADIERARKIERKIDRALKFGRVTLSDDLMQRLMQAVESFIYKTNHMGHMPTGPEVRELVHNLKGSAQAFRQAVEDIRHPRIMRTIPLPAEMKTSRPLKDLIQTIQAWEQAAAISMPQIKKGPGADPFVLELISELAGIYEAATGKQAEPGYFYRVENKIRGEFPQFVAGILDAIAPPAVYHRSRTLVETLIPQALAMLRE